MESKDFLRQCQQLATKNSSNQNLHLESDQIRTCVKGPRDIQMGGIYKTFDVHGLYGLAESSRFTACLYNLTILLDTK